MEKISDDDLQAIIDDNDGSTYGRAFVQALARELLEERKQPKLWLDAPEWATDACITWKAKTHYSAVYKEFTRELPKSPIREIAEKWADDISNYEPAYRTKENADIIESAITEAMALKA